MKGFNLFPTLILEFNLTSHPSKSTLLNIIDNTPPSTLSNHGLVTKGVSSINRNLKDCILDNFQISLLKSDIQKCIEEYHNHTKTRGSRIVQSWFNIMLKGGKTTSHLHNRSILSGAYYPVLENSTCDLIFNSPLSQIKINEISFDPNNPYSQSSFKIPIKEDHLYIFPSWLMHETETNRGGKRVVISFNTGI